MPAAQVMQMFDKAEVEFRELSDKRVIVENDKSKIQKVPPQPMPLKPVVLCLEHALCVRAISRTRACSKSRHKGMQQLCFVVGGRARQPG